MFEYASKAPRELSFRKNEILVVLDKRPSGWWSGTDSRGTKGLFPRYALRCDGVASNVVVSLRFARFARRFGSLRLAFSALKFIVVDFGAANDCNFILETRVSSWGEITAPLSNYVQIISDVTKARAMYDFEGMKNTSQLTLKAGDTINGESRKIRVLSLRCLCLCFSLSLSLSRSHTDSS